MIMEYHITVIVISANLDEMAELLKQCEEILKCVSEGEKDEKTAVAGKL